MAVDPARQRRGIAGKLLAEVLAAVDARGCQVARLDATDAGAPLYEKFGFVDDGIARVFERDERTARPARDVSNVRASPDLREIVAFDERAFGASREKLLARLWSEYRERCVIARDSAGELVGYLFARDPVLGPWVAKGAEAAEAAEALLGAALQLDFTNKPQVMVPRSHDPAAELLAGRGFREQRTLRHMRRGDAGIVGRPEWLFGQSSFAHG
jgi:Acetyltransferase (GNAT) domain